jgi:hypothetical protein
MLTMYSLLVQKAPASFITTTKSYTTKWHTLVRRSRPTF